ncbi:MAG: L-2-hydroxyglutarate oxidase [Elusimicrobia bacterium]|nr:L-2-hydroxyglutarate oxidase [Candidatus Obscuribacterium magneticum]
MKCDFLIVGAGIIGLSVAKELQKRFPRSKIIVIEKEKKPGLHASGRNSGVLHSGIYYPHDTLKAKVCSTGSLRMREFAKDYGIPCERWGKVIVATKEVDQAGLDRLYKNALDNNIRVERLDEKGIKEIEPFSNPRYGGLFSPDTAVIDCKSVLNKLCELLVQNGVQIVFGEEALKFNSKQNEARTSNGVISYGYLFNCGGAYADIIARKFGLASDYLLIPFKGIYFKLHPSKNHLVKSSIYPVPNLLFPFLGVHFTRLISDEVYVGPTAIPSLGRENYGILEGLKVNESLRIGWELMWMSLFNHHRFRNLVVAEVKKYFKGWFLESARELVPSIGREDIIPSTKVGIRPQLVNIKSKKLEMDFVIEKTDRSLHVLNAISPAFTSSFAFAELLVDRAEVGTASIEAFR